MPYEHTTFGALKDILADHLGDPNKVFWTDTELGVYINDALRAWGAASGYWRGRGTFATVSGTAFYPLQTNLSSLLGFTVTDRNVIQAMQFHLLEDASSQIVWSGTDMFTLQEFARFLQQQRNRFLVETGQVLTRSTMNMPGPNIEQVQMADTIIDVRRAAWISDQSVYSTLFREDRWELTAISPGWANNPGTPLAWTQVGSRPLELIIAPPPAVNGTLELITVSTGADLTPWSAATALGIFDNFTSYVKWGAIADLLTGDGPESDPIRQRSAEQRWKEGIELAKLQATIIYAELNGVPVIPGSVYEMDALDLNWQNTTGSPSAIGVMGHNLIALNDVPDGIYSVLLDVVRNAPIPANDATYVDVGREELSPILDYCHYLALFKVGGAELIEAEKHVESFYSAASLYNSRLKASAVFADTITGISTAEEARSPRTVPV